MGAATKEVDQMTDFDFLLGTLNGASELEPYLQLESGGSHRVDAAFHAAYVALQAQISSGEQHLDLQFIIAPHPIHGDSEIVYKGMSFLFSLGYVKQIDYSNRYRFEGCFGRTAEDVYNTIPAGSPDLFRALGHTFSKALRD